MVDELDEIEVAVLSHIARYRLTVPKLLAKTGLLPNKHTHTATKMLHRLVEKKWLQPAELVPENPRFDQYFHLSRRAAKRLGHDAELAIPLKRDLRIESFAILTFCCSGPVFREVFTKGEFVERFKSVWYPGQPVRYYLEPSQNGPPRLAFLKVDKDGPGRWDRLIDSCARFTRKRTDVRTGAAERRPQIEAFASLVTHGRFQITILTALPEKKRAIELELVRRAAAGESVPPLHVHVVPGLLDLMCPSVSRLAAGAG